jgi:hypothetical protein
MKFTACMIEASSGEETYELLVVDSKALWAE